MKLNRYKQHINEDFEIVFKANEISPKDKLGNYYVSIKQKFEDSFQNEFLEHVAHQIATYLQAHNIEVHYNKVEDEVIKMALESKLRYAVKVDRNGLIRLFYTENDQSAPGSHLKTFLEGTDKVNYSYDQCQTLGDLVRLIKMADKLQYVPIKFSHPEKVINFPMTALETKESFEKYMQSVYLDSTLWYGEVCIGGVRYKVSQHFKDKISYTKI